MKTEHELARALKEMMSTRSLDDISVSELSKKCNISRKTFYYHYHDIYDLLTQVFLDEKIANLNSANNINDLIDIIWDYYQKNNRFIDATLDSAGKDLFSEFLYNAIYTTILKFVNRIDVDKVLSLATKRSITRFYAFGYSSSIVYYIENYKNKTLAGLKGNFMFLDDSNLKNSVQKAIKGK